MTSSNFNIGSDIQKTRGQTPEEQIKNYAITTVKTFVTKRPALFSSWLLGLAVAAMGTGFAVQQTQISDYEDAMHHAQQITGADITRAERDLRISETNYYNTKGWFWQCDEVCMQHYNRKTLAEQRVAELQTKRTDLIREARSTVGIWSTVGVSEVRALFWRAWEQGKESAKRWTMMDAMFTMFMPGDRERTIVHVILQLVAQYMANLTVGLCMSMFFFLSSVVSLIYGYGESLISGILFFGLVFCAVMSTVGTYLTVLGGTVAAGTHYVAIKEAQRIEGGAYRRRINQDRPHYA